MLAADGVFDSATLAPGAGFSITIGVAGTHAYSSLSNTSFSGVVRVAVPGLATALALFNAMNLIVEQLITAPRQAAALFAQVPESKRNAIDERDRQADGA